MGRERDQFWDYAVKVNGRFKCNFCGQDFPGSASRLKAHLAGVPGHDIKACNAVPLDVQEKARAITLKKREAQATQGTNKKVKSASTSASKLKTKDKEGYMAEVVLNDVVERLIAHALSLFAIANISFELSFKVEMKNLLETLFKIKFLLDDAQKRQSSDESVRIWLMELRDVAYAADNVLDEFGFESFWQDLPARNLMVDQDEDLEKWDTLKGYLSKFSSSTGNSIVVTTCSDNMAKIMETRPKHQLEKLSKDDCWSIIKKRTFTNGRIPLTLDLEVIGREIAKRCGGVPLAARVLGGTMSFKCDKNKWLEIQNNKIWDLLDEDNSDMFPVLKLCFDHLPTPSLKRCFAYCALFPKDYEMKKSEVILLWMAEGFLEPSKEANVVREDIGNMYFNILLATSFFQNAKKDANGDIISCKMHNLVHDFAISISESEILILEGDSVDNVSEVQPLFVRSDGRSDGETTPRSSSGKGFIKMRTLISKNRDFYDILPSLECLRVLKLFGCSIIRLPNSIEQLIHLRFLHILGTEIEELPKSITKLYNLQTLIIEECPKLTKLLEDLASGPQFCASLQYLEIRSCSNLKSIPESLHTCISLRKFVVFGCPCLRYLPGVPLDIRHLEIIRCGIDELPSGLQSCTSLQFLRIADCPNLKSIPDLGEIFHSLINLKISYHPDLRLKLRQEGHLKTLKIGEFIEELDAFPILRYPFIRYSHASLKKLILFGRPTLNSLPNEIQLFTALEELQIQNFNRMEALPNWFCCLSSLQKLCLYCCKKLMYLPILHLTNLKHLHIDDCRNLEKRCAEGSGAEWLQIAHIPNIKINGKYIRGKDSDNFDSFHDSDCEEFDDDFEDDNLQEDSILENNQLDDNWCQGTLGLENNQLDDN